MFYLNKTFIFLSFKSLRAQGRKKNIDYRWSDVLSLTDYTKTVDYTVASASEMIKHTLKL